MLYSSRLDNVTHSLIGLNLAHAFFKRRYPEAVPTLLLSSNLPDIDGAVLLSPSPLAITWRRTLWSRGRSLAWQGGSARHGGQPGLHIRPYPP